MERPSERSPGNTDIPLTELARLFLEISKNNETILRLCREREDLARLPLSPEFTCGDRDDELQVRDLEILSLNKVNKGLLDKFNGIGRMAKVTRFVLSTIGRGKQ